jgi:hypothetical protein
MTRRVIVNDRMQRRYRYELREPAGRNFAEGFAPDLTPAKMLSMGVFGGKYMTDCRDEFPADWFAHARLSPGRRDPALNFFGVDASTSLRYWLAKGWIHTRRPARLVSVVLPVLHGAAARGRRAADPALAQYAPTREPAQTALHARRPALPSAAAPGLAALGLRFPQALNGRCGPIAAAPSARV